MAISWDGAPWAGLTTYPPNARVVHVGNCYFSAAGGVSSGATPPTDTSSTPITDSAVTWKYLGAFTGSVLDVAGELATGKPIITPSSQALFLSMAERRIGDLEMWGDFLEDGRRLLAAHFGQMYRLKGRGPITAQNVGPLSRSYASLTGEYATNLTPAGRMYDELIHTLPGIFGAV